MERLLLAARWILLPLYAALLLSVLAIYAMVGREVLHLFVDLRDLDDIALTLLLLSILDLVLIANLLVMVAISSYESFISKIDAAAIDDKPEWLGKMDAGNVKLKVALSIIMISAIHLLRAYMNNSPMQIIATLASVHLVFVLSTVAVAYVDRMHRAAH